MKTLMKLTIGDWSKDGHNRMEHYYLNSNYDVHQVREAYKNSCKKTGVTFNHNEDYTGLGLTYDSPRQIWCEYEEREISEDALKILNDFGIDCEATADTEEAAEIIMKFIALSLPDDFKYEFCKLDAEPINGYWNGELNCQFGYGLFSL